jgi:ribose transport system permease protein
VMPQHWVNVWIGIILIVAVLADIWLRQERILQRLWPRADSPFPAKAVAT